MMPNHPGICTVCKLPILKKLHGSGKWVDCDLPEVTVLTHNGVWQLGHRPHNCPARRNGELQESTAAK